MLKTQTNKQINRNLIFTAVTVNMQGTYDSLLFEQFQTNIFRIMIAVTLDSDC